MKQSAVKQSGKTDRVRLVRSDPQAQVEDWSYAKELRALGQALESHQIGTVELEVESGVYFVRGNATANDSAKASFSSLVRDFLFGTSAKGGAKDGEEVRLRYTSNEIRQLDAEARERREDSKKTPDPHSLSQVLRGAGSYLDSKNIQLVGVTVKDRWITLRYRTPEGHLEEAKQDIEYFFDYWVKMYLRRRNRPVVTPSSDPTLIVTWEGIKKQNPTF
ncbi:MAG TPA: hypothetical protein VIB79_10785 [Candidatus Binatia bacterium]|jgi:hypothetical protein